MPSDAAQKVEEQAVVEALRGAADITAELVDRYYTLCIPFYRQFLGEHWHTGFYAAEGVLGEQDTLRMERLVAESAQLTAHSEVLDVGCGIGGVACHLARHSGARIRGLTPNAKQLALARENARRRGLADRVGFDLGEASRLPYADASFDAVLFFESPCHFPERERFFAEAWRVLKPGGRLAGEDWLACELLSEAERAPWIEKVCRSWAIPSLGTVSGYAAAMAAAGFETRLAIDMRQEMALLRGFVVQAADRRHLVAQLAASSDPFPRMMVESLLELGDAAAAGAFTVGRFLAVKPEDTPRQ